MRQQNLKTYGRDCNVLVVVCALDEHHGVSIIPRPSTLDEVYYKRPSREKYILDLLVRWLARFGFKSMPVRASLSEMSCSLQLFSKMPRRDHEICTTYSLYQVRP